MGMGGVILEVGFLKFQALKSYHKEYYKSLASLGNYS